MTENQKRRIKLMRQQHFGYAAIAKELKLSLSTIKSFCRRNSLLSGDLATEEEPQNTPDPISDINLIKSGNRGNSTVAGRMKSIEYAELSEPQAIGDVSVSYAKTPDASAVKDVLNMLAQATYGR